MWALVLRREDEDEASVCVRAVSLALRATAVLLARTSQHNTDVTALGEQRHGPSVPELQNLPADDTCQFHTNP